MRLLLIALAVPLAACSGGTQEADGDSGAFDFHPPTAQPLKDFNAALGRRFNRADRDHNGTLEAADFPKRPERLARWDTNGDGTVTREEFEAAERARFTAADTDKDEILTSAERTRAHWNDLPGATPVPAPAGTPTGTAPAKPAG